MAAPETDNTPTQNRQTVNTDSSDSFVRDEPEKVLFSWQTQSRPFKQRSREFWVRVIAMASISGFIVYIVEGLIPVILMIAIMFLYYILSTVEPKQIEYAITNKGVKIDNELTEADVLTRFWFGDRMGSDLLVLETVTFPGRLELVIKPSDKNKIKAALSKYIPEEKAASTNLEKATDWMSKKFPGNS